MLGAVQGTGNKGLGCVCRSSPPPYNRLAEKTIPAAHFHWKVEHAEEEGNPARDLGKSFKRKIKRGQLCRDEGSQSKNRKYPRKVFSIGEMYELCGYPEPGVDYGEWCVEDVLEKLEH